MDKTFQQFCQYTNEMHTVVIHKSGLWHSRGMRLHDLAAFQEYFGCSDEELAMIKLKHGKPNPWLNGLLQAS